MDAADWKRAEAAAIDDWGESPATRTANQFLPFAGAEPGQRDLTHDGLALELGDDWREDARFVAAWNKWLFYDGWRWKPDETLEHMSRVRQFLRDRADQEEGDVAKRLRSSDTVTRVLSLARSNQAQTATVDQWDADPNILGTPEGVVLLSTGELRAPDPEFYITKATAVPPADDSYAPRWKDFLSRITNEDDDVQRYLQRWAGYCLTGAVDEHAFAFGYGLGANGKSVFINTLKGILGDYALSVDASMFLASQSEAHPTELARLRGIRLAIGSEVEEGQKWAEAKLKRLTGGDPISARFMRQDFFEFNPQFKVFLVGNHKPSLRGVDEGIRRRLHLIPFSVTIPAAERDPNLPFLLRDEWPGILRWAIDGCLAWQDEGLNPPAAVRNATSSYLEAEDAVALWLEESADNDPDAWESSSSLFASWKRWAEKAGEMVGAQKRFAGILQERGYTPHRQGGTGIRGFRGLRLLHVPAAEEGRRDLGL